VCACVRACVRACNTGLRYVIVVWALKKFQTHGSSDGPLRFLHCSSVTISDGLWLN
jgi:hypothetical protein